MNATLQVGTNGGLSQRWRELVKVSSEQDGEYFQGGTDARNCDAGQLDAAKLRIEEAVKALPNASIPGGWRDGGAEDYP
jgi:hypothetical protein